MTEVQGSNVPQGMYTTTVYTHIKNQAWDDAIGILAQELENFPRSRAALSLLGYCQYHAQNFAQASAMYERLVLVCPDQEQYKVYHAQALYKAGLYQEAIRVASTVDSDDYIIRMQKLRAAIRYEMDDIPGCKSHLSKCDPSDPDVIIMTGCVYYKEGAYDDAITCYNQAISLLDFRADLQYNIALCYYRQRKFFPSLTAIAEIVQRGLQHTQLSIGFNTDGQETRSVGNTALLRETATIEAFNLKAAIEYSIHNEANARVALSDMPPRLEEELDPVTLHNTALMHVDSDPAGCFTKLRWLLSSGKFPPETYSNLLLLYVKYGYTSLAADVLADNPHLTKQFLTEDIYQYIQARMIQESDPSEAYRMLDRLAQKHVEQLRRIMREIQEEKAAPELPEVDGQSPRLATMRVLMARYDNALEAFIPVLMAQAEIYWNIEHWQMVEKIFRQSVDFAADDATWQVNHAHVLYMQEKYADCIRYYESVIQTHSEKGLLSCSAIVLANLCVSLVMTNGNTQAEELMRDVEQAETAVIQSGSGPYPLHLCIINLVIGTLYCAKGNFDFGISRIMKSLEPYDKKIMPDTWYYAKRCFLALADTLAKSMILVKDSLMTEILAFFDAANLHGKAPAKVVDDPMQQHGHVNTIQHEARVLKRLFLMIGE